MELSKIAIVAKILLVLTISSLCDGRPSPVIEDALFNVESLKMFVDELPQMPKLHGYGPSSQTGYLSIGMYAIRWKFHRDLPATPVFAYGTSKSTATVPGPFIEAMQGVPTHITWKNHLPKNHILPWDPTIQTAIPQSGGVPAVVHLHGGIHPPQSDGSSLAWFTANFNETGVETGPHWTNFTYYYPNAQHAGNLWYHDHTLGLTRVNLLAGLIGPYVIKDQALDEQLNLPSGEFDRVLMVFDRSFNVDGSLYMNRTGNSPTDTYPTLRPQWQPEYFGDAIIVNGKAWPYLKVQRRKYRFRIINSSNARYYNFSLTSGLSFNVVGSDASYLPSPVKTKTILLAPSEIIDVVVDFNRTTASKSVLQNSAAYPYPSGDSPDKLNSKIMKFIIEKGHPNSPDTSSIPKKCKNYNATQEHSNTRHIALYEYTTPDDEPTHLLINGMRFSDPATEKPRVGSTEIWEVINLTDDNHPLHIHLAEFQAIKRRGLVDVEVFTACMKRLKDAVACNMTEHAIGEESEVPAYEKTWKNVVKMEPGNVTTVLVKFNLVENDAPYPFDATAEPGYVYHCHILDHEDNAMIRPLKLVN